MTTLIRQHTHINYQKIKICIFIMGINVQIALLYD